MILGGFVWGCLIERENFLGHSNKFLNLHFSLYICSPSQKEQVAQVAKLVDAPSSGGGAARCAGSNPVLGTIRALCVSNHKAFSFSVCQFFKLFPAFYHISGNTSQPVYHCHPVLNQD
jgi:hypothetical protein